jgi:tRNA U38,U39,U40 pseudouridine synthase TruA
MASYKDAATVANDATFQNRCLHAAEVTALAVMAESGTVPNHQARVDFCRQIINGAVPGSQIARAVVTNATVNAAINVANLTTDAGVTDAQLQTAVNAVLPSVAGIANTP